MVKLRQAMRGREKEIMGTGIKVFLSYAHEDRELCEQLEKHLSLLKRLGTISTWYDRAISAGSEWKHEIEKHLNTARIILLLVSPDFIASDYCYSVEMARAMERHARGEARVIPILLRPALWKDIPLQRLKSLPANGIPITEWNHQDKVFTQIVEGIKDVVQELQEPTRREGKQQEKGKDVPSPRNPKMDQPALASPAQDKKYRAPKASSEQPARSQAHNQTSNVFHGPVQGAISGGINTITITALPPAEDLVTKARSEAQRGYSALQRKDYNTAKRCLEAADLALSEDEQPTEAAQIKYHLALALLNGRRPFSDSMTKSTMESIEQLLRLAIKLQSLHSYYYTLALLKRDFARYGLHQYQSNALTLFRKAQRINLTETDNVNLRLLTLCQPRLVDDARHW